MMIESSQLSAQRVLLHFFKLTIGTSLSSAYTHNISKTLKAYT